ncbi:MULTISPECIES: BrnT family toxin [unclassified Limnohabitans]|uniref:BrnT family toxin n=1 Tax=Limnohabitans sp. WS1 TaxID=1100726 RepID=UPI000B7E9035|nr:MULTISPECIES: BrnT family toxin [unclassified Limnohabitans]PUE14242.1 hypothetical protein B9Z48_13675 [Limnohabitans sp. WS1]
MKASVLFANEARYLVEFRSVCSRCFKKHGVSFAHAEQALRDEYGLTMDDPDAQGEQRFLTLGMDALGRVLVVCHTQRDERRRLISARKASPNEARNYHA